VKLFNYSVISLLLCGLLCGASACGLSNLAGGKNMSAARSENQPSKTGAAEQTGAANQASTETSADNDTPEVEGTYGLNNHREGKGGYVNNLIVERADKGKIRVSFEGTYFFQANGAETFHDSSAYGTLTLKGNVASGKLTEEGSENGCTIELNFAAGGRVNLKSSNCDLNVTPDGVYLKGAEDKSKNLDADVVQGKTRQNSNNPGGAFIQYDDAGEPVALVNLMEHEGEREGCGDEVRTFTGKAITVESNGDFDFEFTLVDGNRKRQKITLVVDSDDKLPYDDLHSLIKTGNNLEVRFIYCGNGGFATPTAIYKQ
jgi:hypothetical protein